MYSFEFMVGPWGTCSAHCGYGIAKREVLSPAHTLKLFPLGPCPHFLKETILVGVSTIYKAELFQVACRASPTVSRELELGASVVVDAFSSSCIIDQQVDE